MFSSVGGAAATSIGTRYIEFTDRLLEIQREQEEAAVKAKAA
jgi:hypothetical protein